jgi:hypothetical protein
MSNVLLFVYFSDKITDKFKKLSIVHNLFLLSPLAKKKKTTEDINSSSHSNIFEMGRSTWD